MAHRRTEITRLLQAWGEGDSSARDELMPLVADELRRIAQLHFDREPSGHTLQPTAVVNELYLRLVDKRSIRLRNRRHFFGFASREIRRILVDHSRRRNAEKRGDRQRPVSLDELSDLTEPQCREIVEVHDALKSLARVNRRQSVIVELSYFGGLSFAEIGEILGTSRSTVRRQWRSARLWLDHAIRHRDADEPPAEKRP